MSALLFLRPLLRPHASRLLAAFGLVLVTLAAGIALLGLSGWFLTAASLTTAGVLFNLFGPSAGVRGLSLLRIVSRYGEKLIGHDATLRILGDLRGWLVRRLMPRVPALRKGLRRGDLVSRLTADVDALDTILLVGLGPLAANLATGAGMTALLALTLPGALPAYLPAILLSSIGVPLLFLLATRRSRAGEALVEAVRDMRVAALDAIEGHADLLAFGRCEAARRDFAALAARMSRARSALGLRGSLGGLAVQFCAGAALLGVLLAGLAALATEEIGGPLLVGLLLAALASFEASALVVRGMARLAQGQAAAERLKALAQAPENWGDPADPRSLPDGCTLVFEGVTVGYDPERPVLRDLDLVLDAGEHLVLQGPSGSGKSTLLHLPVRLAEPDRGTIRIAGADITAVRRADLCARVALLEQNAPVFLDTVRGNLLLGRENASSAELWTALDDARLGDFVRSLEGGLDTPLGEGGRTLSVGQARRLCLARILLTGATILLLDEPTSGLDPETEAAFFRDLERAARGRTVIVATHAEIEPSLFRRRAALIDGRLG